MTDAYDPFRPAPFAEIAKTKRSRPPEPRPPVAAEPDPFASPPANCRLSGLPTNDGTTPLRAAPRRPKLSLVHGRAQKARVATTAQDDDPFPGPADGGEVSPPARLSDDRRCGLDDPFGAPLQLPAVLVGRDWDGCLRLHAFAVDGLIEQSSLRTTSEDAAFAEAERVAIRLHAALVTGIQSSLTIAAIESTIRATVAAMTGGGG